MFGSLFQFDLHTAAQKWIASFLAFLFLLFPFLQTGATLTLDAPATTESEQISFTLQNKTPQDLSYGIGSYTLERQTTLGWREVPVHDDFVYIKILYVCPAGGKSKVVLDVIPRFGKLLDAGDYRVTVHCGTQNSTVPTMVQTVFTVSAA